MFESITIVVSVILAAWLGFWFACKQMRINTKIRIQQDFNRRQANALEHAWQLLAYLSKNENQYSLIRWERQTVNGQKQDKYYLDQPNARQFIDQTLPEVFYLKHAGLYWDNELKEQLFQCRSQLYGIMLKTKKPDTPKILIENDEIRQTVYQTYDMLNIKLRQEIIQLYQKMPE